MKKQQQQSITSLPSSPDDERRARVVKYTVAMSVRLLCVVLCFFVHGWLLVIAVAAALILPYFAVIVANTATSKSAGTVERPGSIVRLPPSDETGSPR